MPLGNPFEFSSDPNAPGLGGMPQGFWQDLATFGGNLASAANARTASGHLANGADFAGAFGAAIPATMQYGRQNAITRAGLQRSAAETQGLQLQNMASAMQLPLLQAQVGQKSQFWSNPSGYLDNLYGAAPGGSTPPGGSTVPGLAQSESGGRSDAVNAGGYSGAYQFGKARLADLGFYQPAPNENMADNKNWSGKLTVGPFNVTDRASFLASRPAQDFVQRASEANIDQAIANTPGADKFDRNGLQAVAHLGGVAGMQKFVATGGAYNPADANGTSLSDYYNKFSRPRGVAARTGGVDVAGPGAGSSPSAGAPTQLAPAPAQQPAAAETLAAQYEAQAQHLMWQANRAAAVQQMGGFSGVDPKALRDQAIAYTQEALKLRAAGPQASATAAAEAPYKPITDRFGNIYLPDGNGGMKFLGRGSEVKEVYNPATGNYEWGDVGGVGVGAPGTVGHGQAASGGAGGGGMVAKPGPGQLEYQKGAATVQQNTIEHEGKTVDEDLSHMLETVLPAKQALFQLRDHIDGADTGALGDFRATIKNYVQTFFPSAAASLDMNAEPAQIFKKLALISAGKQERGDLGARGGFRAIEMYSNANPNLEMQPGANRDMANALLIAHQAHEDYARGAADYYNQQYQDVQDKGTTRGYQRLSKYDAEYAAKFRPELYVAAINAINGAPSDKWAKGLTAQQIQIVGGILQRTDPNAVIDIRGQQVPVSTFKNTISPIGLLKGGNGGG